jgi:CheY-like chemotaxis protein
VSHSTDTPKPAITDQASANSFATASSELNNLLQIISGTSAIIENASVGNEGAEEYVTMLRASIARAEKIAADLTQHAGGTAKKSSMHPELARFNRSKSDESLGSSTHSILLVDDETMALTLIKRILSGAGFNVATASSGFQCLELVRQQPQVYDLILLDLTMPFMDGEETFNRLRGIRDDIPVVLCTGFIEQEKLDRLMSAGLAGFLRKPIPADEIVSFVRSTLASLRYSRGMFDSAGASIAI